MIEMLNQLVMVGRIANKPELRKTETGKNVTTITLAVPRNYKNMNGEYDTDFVDCILWGGVAENTAEYCKKGDIVGVKGRIQTNNYRFLRCNEVLPLLSEQLRLFQTQPGLHCRHSHS